jgi:hypothetical protein
MSPIEKIKFTNIKIRYIIQPNKLILSQFYRIFFFLKFSGTKALMLWAASH